MMDSLRKLWRDYNLSLVLLVCFILSWVFQAWTGWREFAAEQAEHHQTAAVFGDSGYIWTFAAATFENWQSEFLQLLAMVAQRIDGLPEFVDLRLHSIVAVLRFSAAAMD
jgi:hypothetical protein